MKGSDFMKTRVISAVVAIIIGIGAFFLLFTPVFGLFVSFITALATYEIMHVGGVKNKPLTAVSVIFSALLPQYLQYGDKLNFDIPDVLILSGYLLLLFVLMFLKYEKTKISHVAMAFTGSVIVSYSISCLILIRDIFSVSNATYYKKFAIYFVLYGLLCAWVSDTFALFIGSKFGKHKLCPKISPKKTVEGAAGGVVCNVMFNVLLFIILDKLWFDTHITGIVFIAVSSFFLAIAGIVGDLSASSFKRVYKAKDYGNIMPGHGGVMDRFDSCLFILPVLYGILKIIVK